MAQVLPWLILLYDDWEFWAWADDAHIAPQNIDELRQLIDRSRAKELSKSRVARVRGRFMGASPVALHDNTLLSAVGLHCPELQYGERNPTFSDALLAKENALSKGQTKRNCRE
jgi:hypothetical protein